MFLRQSLVSLRIAQARERAARITIQPAMTGETRSEYAANLILANRAGIVRDASEIPDPFDSCEYAFTLCDSI